MPDLKITEQITLSTVSRFPHTFQNISFNFNIMLKSEISTVTTLHTGDIIHGTFMITFYTL